MSALANIRKALETQLDAILDIALAWENVSFTPAPGVPYAAVYLMPAQPDNPEMGPGYVEQGLLQVSLFYPLNEGPGGALATAEIIRAAFPFGSAFTANGTTVSIYSTPEIGVARPDDDRFMIPVRIRWRAMVGG